VDTGDPLHFAIEALQIGSQYMKETMSNFSILANIGSGGNHDRWIYLNKKAEMEFINDIKKLYEQNGAD